MCVMIREQQVMHDWCIMLGVRRIDRQRCYGIRVTHGMVLLSTCSLANMRALEGIQRNIQKPL
jgi:hypothetical protein